MADNWLVFIPTTPMYIPTVTQQIAAQHYLQQCFPLADVVDTLITDEVVFVDSGANFEKIVCPYCAKTIDIEWWQQAMEIASAKQFAILGVVVPCCKKIVSLNDLSYHWPAGFARFRLRVLNPNDNGDDHLIGLLAETLGSPLRRIWAHY